MSRSNINLRFLAALAVGGLSLGLGGCGSDPAPAESPVPATEEGSAEASGEAELLDGPEVPDESEAELGAAEDPATSMTYSAETKDGYTYTIHISSASFAETEREVASQKPGEVELRARFRAEGNVVNTTAERETALGPASVLAVYPDDSAVCQALYATPNPALKQLRLPGLEPSGYCAFARGALSLPRQEPLAPDADVPVSAGPSGVFVVPEVDEAAVAAAIPEPAFWALLANSGDGICSINSSPGHPGTVVAATGAGAELCEVSQH